jgi:hypothetical protein
MEVEQRYVIKFFTDEGPSLALGPAYGDSGSKSGACRIGGTHATGASKTGTQPFAFLVDR